ncbi:MAG: hypothetical protein U0Q47_01350 [Mycobacterium sp.]
MVLSWELALRAQRKSPQTVKSYGDGVRAFIRWCESRGHYPALGRTLVQGFTAGLLDGGAEPSTARSRQLGMRATPMSSRQKRKLEPLNKFDPDQHSHQDQCQIIRDRVEQFKGREQINRCTRDVKTQRQVRDDLIYEEYRLGFGVPPVGSWVLWDILAAHARAGGFAGFFGTMPRA